MSYHQQIEGGYFLAHLIHLSSKSTCFASVSRVDQLSICIYQRSRSQDH